MNESIYITTIYYLFFPHIFRALHLICEYIYFLFYVDIPVIVIKYNCIRLWVQYQKVKYL
ncbi:hypothetical protein PFBG_00348 [Plasmodium falciparum 7G8]|uniref:Uncharacterized protein n=2 Tax=Plasmodium falciparum TaxID=5833 RepID=W7FMF8_PLAF8|nr:hypothetical protein PFNF135_00511 [Plasmodium falciparum NF135/5.C10]EUR80985.1 hypothetical protein PFBG_00348 [Plasmodium falciparum 7G8]